jgi:hypothetical protein
VNQISVFSSRRRDFTNPIRRARFNPTSAVTALYLTSEILLTEISHPVQLQLSDRSVSRFGFTGL